MGSSDMPAFHDGEMAVQRRMNAADVALTMADYVTRQDVTPPAAHFLELQTLAAVAYVGTGEQVRLDLLSGPRGFVEVIDSRTLRITPAAGISRDLRDALRAGSRLGLTAIDLTTRRRAKCKCWAVSDGQRIDLRIDRIYALCPKYIQKREEPKRWQPHRSEHPLQDLGPEVNSVLKQADTAFIATFTRSPRPGRFPSRRQPGVHRCGRLARELAGARWEQHVQLSREPRTRRQGRPGSN